MNLDFETYSEIDIKVGAFRYAQDSSTEIICMAYSFDDADNDKVNLWHPGLNEEPKDFLDHIGSGGIIRGWNCSFEYSIINYVGHRLFNWPQIKVEQIRCTMTDALALSLPASLGQCAEALEITQQKDKKGKRLIHLLSKPKKWSKAKPYTRVTPEIDPEAFEEFYSYCIQDVKTEIDIFKTLPRHVKGEEQELYELTCKINERGIPIDVDLVSAVLEAKSDYEERLNKEIYAMSDGFLESTNSRPKSIKWLKDNGVILEGYTKGDVKKALERDDICDSARRFLEIRSELSRTPIKKYDFVNRALCSDNTIKNNIIFHKASTGRFAGSGFQIQNLPRDASKNPEELVNLFLKKQFKGMSVINEALKLIRPIVKAPKGKKLIVSDFSSIENRVIAWLARDYETLKDFEKGVDQYKRAAESIYLVAYDDVTKDQRQLGKIAVLACCFGGGSKTFRTICETSWGISISEEQSKDIVDGYRAKYKKIVNFWYSLYDAAMDAVTTKRVTVCNDIKFRKMGDFLHMRLPNGRFISYYKPIVKEVTTPWGAKKMAITHMGLNTYTRRWERITIIPGRLTENAVQATARDFLTEAMQRIEKKGYDIIGCVHDEIISCVDVDFGSLKDFNNIMTQSPKWALDCPIEAEGYVDTRYRK